MSIMDRARKEFERNYDSKMTIKVHKTVKDGLYEKQEWVDLVVDEPCRVSVGAGAYKPRILVEGQHDGGYYQQIIYFRPNFNIPIGSRIVVTDHWGVIREYAQTGEVLASYITHSEMTVKRTVVA